MKNNEKDIFEITQSTKRTVENSGNERLNSNFFLQSESPVMFDYVTNSIESSRRLNDYDFNLLEEEAYKDVTDEVLKIEYKITKIENEFKVLNSQLMAAKDINDYNLIETLNNRKQILENEYKTLIAQYNEKSVSARMTEGMTNILGSKIKNNVKLVKNKMAIAAERLVSKLPGPLSSVFELKKSLGKLENINRSVDELITLRIPYGEDFNKYEQLSKFIIKANSIQTEIKRHLNK